MDGYLDEIVVHHAISNRLEKACAGVDIAGYNYMTARYEGDGENYPNRVIVGSETYPPEIARNWDLVEKLPHVIGDFTWTGWDYIGEPVLESLHMSWAKVDSELDSRHSLHIREILISLGSAVRHLITEKQFLDLV